jgi:tetratricopeptide (TPR) repeat protein
MPRTSSSFCTALLLAAAAAAPACRTLPKDASCWSLDGRALAAPAVADARRADLERDLAAAREAFARAPRDVDAAVWVARRLGYLGRFREAVEVLTDALYDHPRDPHLLRHRGHRWLTLREFGRACYDLERAAQACRTTPDAVEPDGQPTPGRPPHSTLHYNVHYHLGLALFCAGNLAAAGRAWLDCLAVVANDESRVAVTHWLWSVRMRLGDTAGAAAVVAPIHAGMDVVENRGYLQLCLVYAGTLAREAIVVPEGSAGAALAFGLAHRQLVCGERAAGIAALRELARSPGWPAFGVLAAEAVLQQAVTKGS